MGVNEVKLIVTTDAAGAITGIRGFEQEFTAATRKMEAQSSSFASKVKANYLGITAAIAVVSAAAYKAWDLMGKAADYADQKKQLNDLAGQYNTTANEIIRSIQDISDNMISMSDIVNTSTDALTKGLDPTQLQELAKYADAVGDKMKTSAAEGFNELVVAAEMGRKKTIENIVGLIDLNAVYGAQVDKMSDVDKAHARAAIMLDRLRQLYPAVGTEVQSFGDKMEQLKATAQNAELWIGSLSIRIATGLAGAFNVLGFAVTGVAKIITSMPAAVEKMLNGIGWMLEKINKLSGKEIFQPGFIDGLKSSFWSDTMDEQAKLMDGFVAGAKDNFRAMTASSDELASAMAKPRNEIKGLSKDAEDAAKKIADLNKQLQGKVDQMALSPFEQLDKEVEEYRKAGADKTKIDEYYALKRKEIGEKLQQEDQQQIQKGLDEYEKGLNEREKLFEDEIKQEEGLLGQQIEAEKAAHEMMFQATATDLEKRLHEQDKWFESYVDLLLKEGQADEVTNEKILKGWEVLQQKKQELMAETPKTFAAGWAKGSEDYIKSLEDAYSRGEQLNRDFAREGERALIDMWDDPKDAAKGFFDFLLFELKRTIAEFAMNPIMVEMKGVFNGAGGGMFSGVGGFMNTPFFPATNADPNFIGPPQGSWYNSITPGNVLAAGAGAYGVYGAYQAGDPLGGAMSGAMMGSPFGPIGMAVGAIIGGLAGLFGGDDEPPKTKLKYYPGGEGLSAEYKERYGDDTEWGLRHWDLLGDENTNIVIDTMDGVKDLMEIFFEGLGKTPEEIAAKFAQEWTGDKVKMGEGFSLEDQIQAWMKDYVKTVSNVDFTQFARDGEQFIATVGRIVAAVVTLKEFGEWDAAKAFDELDIHANTMQEAINKLTTTITEDVTKLNSGTLGAEEWGDLLSTTAENLVALQQAAIAYVAHIKALGEALHEGITAQITQYQLNAMTLMETIAYFSNQAAGLWNDLLKESDPDKIGQISTELTGSIDSLYNALMSLKQAVESVAQSAASTYESMYMEMLPDDQARVDYINQQIDADWAAYNKAKAAGDTEAMARLGAELTELINQGWDLAGVDKEKSWAELGPMLQTIEMDMKDASKGLEDAMGNLVPILEGLDTTISEKLTKAIADLSAQIAALGTAIEGIDMSQLEGPAPATGQDVVPAPVVPIDDYPDPSMHQPVPEGGGWSPDSPLYRPHYRPHFFGLDNVPYDGYKASLHQAEAVLNAGANAIIPALPGMMSAIMDRLGNLEKTKTVVNVYVADRAGVIDDIVAEAADTAEVRILRRASKGEL